MDSSDLLQSIAALPYYSPHYSNEPAAREIRRLFELLYPDEEKELCKTCNQDYHYRYNKLKNFLKQSGFDMKDQAKFRYRFPDDETMFRIPFENEFYSNANLTDEIAVELIEKAPHLKGMLIIDESVPAPLSASQIEKAKAEAEAEAEEQAKQAAAEAGKEQERITAKVKAELEAKAKKAEEKAKAEAEAEAAKAEEKKEGSKAEAPKEESK